jgi:AcrR family transcriptional regulator
MTSPITTNNAQLENPEGPLVTFAPPELRVLKAARALLRDGGYRHVTMHRLADGAGCTRPTVYRYFADVDDVIAALCIQAAARRLELCGRLSRWDARPRERYSAVGAVLQEVSPHHMAYESILYTPGFLARIRPERRRMLMELEDRELDLSSEIIEDAITRGDLRLPSYLTPVQLAISISSVALGMQFLILRGSSRGGRNLEAPLRTWARTMNVIMDDLGWRPLSTELDYVASAYRMWREVFPDILERFGVDLEGVRR